MAAASKKKVILTVDDVSMNLSMTKIALTKYFDVRVAKSGELALFILGSVKVDLILLDIEMPGMSGFEFINIVRDIPDIKDIPIIFMTAHANSSDFNQAIRAGAKDYIVKPIKVEMLVEKVFKALNMPTPNY